MVRKGSGWHGEPKRHSDAIKKGMKTRHQGKTGVKTVKRKTPKRIVENKILNESKRDKVRKRYEVRGKINWNEQKISELEEKLENINELAFDEFLVGESVWGLGERNIEIRDEQRNPKLTLENYIKDFGIEHYNRRKKQWIERERSYFSTELKQLEKQTTALYKSL